MKTWRLYYNGYTDDGDAFVCTVDEGTRDSQILVRGAEIRRACAKTVFVTEAESSVKDFDGFYIEITGEMRIEEGIAVFYDDRGL